MEFLDLTLATAAENLALDEALLDAAELADQPRELLRLWESPTWAVVLGRSSRIDAEVQRAECRQRNVPILRRSSGGAAVVIGPGCLMYSVVLSYERQPQLALLDEAHRFVLDRVVAAVARLVPGVLRAGTSDLALAGRKVSGNSLRCKRRHLLYHGTLLYDFDLSLISGLLDTAPRQPAYRGGRSHAAFVANLPASVADLRRVLVESWEPRGKVADWPRQAVAQLVAERFSQPAWNERL